HYQRAEDHLDARVREAQRRHALPVDHLRGAHRTERGLTDRAIVTEPFNLKQTAVGLKADLPERREIVEPLADADVAGVVDRRLGAQRAARLVVLLYARSCVVNVQRGGDPFGEHPGAEAAGGAARDPAAEDQLDAVGPADVEILANDLLEENAPGGGAVE